MAKESTKTPVPGSLLRLVMMRMNRLRRWIVEYQLLPLAYVITPDLELQEVIHAYLRRTVQRDKAKHHNGKVSHGLSTRREQNE